jgi:5-methylcytosine-specific restriction endonuclease McrA
MSHNIASSTRLKLLKAQKNRCFYCGIKLCYGQVDHVDPRKCWGERHLVKKKYVVSCQYCNSSKWAYPLLAWKARLQVEIDAAQKLIKLNKRRIRSIEALIL